MRAAQLLSVAPGTSRRQSPTAIRWPRAAASRASALRTWSLHSIQKAASSPATRANASAGNRLRETLVVVVVVRNGMAGLLGALVTMVGNEGPPGVPFLS